MGVLSISAVISLVCLSFINPSDCEKKLNECLDIKIWEHRERISAPSDEVIEMFINNCVEELKR
jgi:hypothetical protein